MPDEYALCVKSNLVNLEQIARFVSDQAKRLGMAERQIYDIQMAVDEACTNSMEHAYNGDPTGEVTICCYAEDDDMVIKITDFGAQFDATLIPPPDFSRPLEERRVGGLGIYLMTRLMDSVQFRKLEPFGNEVIMRKHIDNNHEVA